MTRLRQQLVGARSLLALDFLTVIDAFTPGLKAMGDNPPKLQLCVRGKMKEWRADYEMTLEDGTLEYVMVRTVEWLFGRNAKRAAFRRDFLLAMEFSAKRVGRKFRLVTEEQIRVQPRLENARMMQRHLVPYRERHGEMAAIEALSRLPESSSVAALQERLGNRFDAFAVAIQLDWLGHLRLDRRTKFSRSSSFVKT